MCGCSLFIIRGYVNYVLQIVIRDYLFPYIMLSNLAKKHNSQTDRSLRNVCNLCLSTSELEYEGETEEEIKDL